ncbi:D-2-hydroxyacid dehydrogenase family protein [Roseobacter sp.]|uniref:D-2-hydroxyacid dehydrogenase family protein n=1 Tax=Roseobacter sp. TaxID=1907202 RepID=UPI00385F68DF
MKVHILDDWFDTLRTLPCFAKLDDCDVTVWTDHQPDPDLLAERVRAAEALVLFRERTKIGAPLLQQLPNLKLISQRSVYPHIDVNACTTNHVLLCSNMHSDTPSYAAAEHTLALILASYRQIPEQVASLRSGQWQSGVGRTLRGRILGLYGYGRIANSVAEYAKALGMKVQWWASDDGRDRAARDGESVSESRSAFFSSSDIISIHVRLKPATHGLITGEDLALMKPRALFVNTSRSHLVAQGALECEVARDRIHAAIDVFDDEPMTDVSNPLLCHPNVLATPHIGYVTEDEFDLQFADIFDQIIAYREGVPINMINSDVWREQ